MIISPVVTNKMREMGYIAEKPPAKRSDMICKLTLMKSAKCIYGKPASFFGSKMTKKQ